jgi:hypothetical protein
MINDRSWPAAAIWRKNRGRRGRQSGFSDPIGVCSLGFPDTMFGAEHAN